LTSVPVAGEVIQNAQRRGVEDVQGRVVNRAFGLGAETPLPAGRNSGEVIRNANQAASALYDAAVPHLRANPEGIMDAAAAYNRAVQNPQLTPDAVRTLQGLWDNNFANYAALDGQGLKALDSELGKLARDYSGHMASPSDRALSGALVDIKLALRGGLEQGMAPEHVHLLRTANRAYRNLIPVNKAASTRADRLATPRALEKAMAKQAGTDVTRTADDPLISRAVELTTPTVADSQTAGRAAMQSIPHLLSGLVAGLPAAALYSRTGTNLALGRTELQRLLAPYSDRVRTAIIAALRQ